MQSFPLVARSSGGIYILMSVSFVPEAGHSLPSLRIAVAQIAVLPVLKPVTVIAYGGVASLSGETIAKEVLYEPKFICVIVAPLRPEVTVAVIISFPFANKFNADGEVVTAQFE